MRISDWSSDVCSSDLSLKQDGIESILSINKDVLPKYGGMTVERMRQLIKSSQERGWSVVGNAAVPGVLGVGVAVQRPVGQPNLAVSVSSILERMPQIGRAHV